MESDNTSNWSIKTKLLYVLIFFSGMSALIYQLIWIRQMNIIFGVGHFAVATVISIFLLGLGIGGNYFGKVAERSKNILKTYGLLELIIALSSLLVFFFIEYIPIFGLLHRYFYNHFGLYLLSIARLFLTFIILIIPTMAMGGTIPLISKYLLISNEKFGAKFDTIYYINTLGAFIGVITTDLILIKYFGVINSLIFAASLNILIFIIIFSFKKYSRIVPNQTLTSSPNPTLKPKNKFLIIIFFSGLISIGYEILWIRVLNNFGSGTSLSSAIILSGFLLGFVIGSIIIIKIINKSTKLIKLYAQFLLISCIIGAVIIYFFSQLNIYIPNAFYSFKLLITEYFVAFIASLLMATSLGALFPLGVKIFSENINIIGSKIGRVYLISSIGTITGSLLCGFLFIPRLGIKILAYILVFLSLIIVIYLQIKYKIKMTILISTTLLIIAISIFFSGNVFYRLNKYSQNLFYAEGLSATITVIKQNDTKTLLVDSQAVASNSLGGLIDAKILAHLPLSLIDTPQSAATIGYGSGVTSYSMSLHDIDVTALEIENEVINSSQEFSDFNHNADTLPNVNIIIDDARNYLTNTDNKFDAIVTDVTNLKYKSNPYLYTTDYFQIMKNRLSEKGIAAAWVPLSGLSFEDLRILIASFNKIFPNTSIWYYHLEPTSFLTFIGTPSSLKINIDDFYKRLDLISVDLNVINLTNKYDFISMLILGEQDVDDISNLSKIHTDNNPILEFSDIKYYYEPNYFENLDKLMQYQSESLIDYYIGNDLQKSIVTDKINQAKNNIASFLNL